MNILLSTCNVAGKNGIIRMEDISEVYLKPVPREVNQTTLYIVTKTGITKSIFNGANEDAQIRYDKLVLAMGATIDLETMGMPEIEDILAVSEDVIQPVVQPLTTPVTESDVKEKEKVEEIVEETPQPKKKK